MRERDPRDAQQQALLLVIQGGAALARVSIPRERESARNCCRLCSLVDLHSRILHAVMSTERMGSERHVPWVAIVEIESMSITNSAKGTIFVRDWTVPRVGQPTGRLPWLFLIYSENKPDEGGAAKAVKEEEFTHILAPGT